MATAMEKKWMGKEAEEQLQLMLLMNIGVNYSAPFF